MIIKFVNRNQLPNSAYCARPQTITLNKYFLRVHDIEMSGSCHSLAEIRRHGRMELFLQKQVETHAVSSCWFRFVAVF